MLAGNLKGGMLTNPEMLPCERTDCLTGMINKEQSSIIESDGRIETLFERNGSGKKEAVKKQIPTICFLFL